MNGDREVTQLRLRDPETGAAEDLATDAVVFFTGLVPNAGLAEGHAGRDSTGRVMVDAGMRSAAPGLCAIGNVRAGALHRAAAAMGDTATAAAALDRYLADGCWAEI